MKKYIKPKSKVIYMEPLSMLTGSMIQDSEENTLNLELDNSENPWADSGNFAD